MIASGSEEGIDAIDLVFSYLGIHAVIASEGPDVHWDSIDARRWESHRCCRVICSFDGRSLISEMVSWMGWASLVFCFLVCCSSLSSSWDESICGAGKTFESSFFLHSSGNFTCPLHVPSGL